MTQRLRSISAFLTAWLFAFSLLSNCYCQPAFASAPQAQSAAAHCSHHSSKTQDCAPRIQNDQFEIAVSQIHFDLKAQAEIFVIPDIFSASDFSSGEISKISPPQESPPPQFFLLHHSFLI